MKLVSILVILCISLVYAQQQQSCKADYECNSIPNGLCAGSLDDCRTLLPGLAVDEVNKVIYYSAQCRAPVSDNSSYPLPNATIKRISIDGSTPTNIYTSIYYPAPGNINRIFTVVNGTLYYDKLLRSIGNLLVAFNLSVLQETFPYPGPGGFQSRLDIGSSYSFTCQYEPSGANASYSIFRYRGALGQPGASSDGVRIYSFGNAISCGPIKLGRGSDLIITRIHYIYNGQTTVYTTSFSRGSVLGNTDVFLFNVSGFVEDFDVVDMDGSIVYGTSNGLFRRVGTATTILNNEAINGVYVSGQRIYYNNGLTIRSTTLNGQTSTSLIQPTTGQCVCRYGFSGNNCRTCNNGQIQYSYDGIPSCVPLNEAGVPVRCSFDYQCGNVPFTVCFGTCSCRANFTGNRCDACAAPRTTTFRNGIPYCE